MLTRLGTSAVADRVQVFYDYSDDTRLQSACETQQKPYDGNAHSGKNASPAVSGPAMVRQPRGVLNPFDMTAVTHSGAPAK